MEHSHGNDKLQKGLIRGKHDFGMTIYGEVIEHKQ